MREREDAGLTGQALPVDDLRLQPLELAVIKQRLLDFPPTYFSDIPQKAFEWGLAALKQPTPVGQFLGAWVIWLNNVKALQAFNLNHQHLAYNTDYLAHLPTYSAQFWTWIEQHWNDWIYCPQVLDTLLWRALVEGEFEWTEKMLEQHTPSTLAPSGYRIPHPIAAYPRINRWTKLAKKTNDVNNAIIQLSYQLNNLKKPANEINAAISQAFHQGANLRTPNAYGETLLMNSVLRGEKVIVDHLSRHHPGCNSFEFRLLSACFIEAAKLNRLDIIDCLLGLNLNINTQNAREESPLYAAIVHGHAALVERLLRHGARLNEVQQNRLGEQYLWSLRFNQRFAHDNLLVNLGNLQFHDDINQSPLISAIEHGDKQAIQNLKAQGVHLSDDDKSMLNQALFEAVDAGIHDTISALLNSGADVNAASPQKTHPLILAAKKGDVKTVELLLSHGAKLTPDDKRMCGKHLLHVIENHDAPTANCLIEMGACLEQTNKAGLSLLYLAANSGQIGIVKTLQAQGAKLNAADKPELNTQLRQAVDVKNKPRMDALELIGASLKAIFETALKTEDIQLMKKLIESGVDVNNTQGDRSFLAHAIEYNAFPIIKQLVQAKATLRPQEHMHYSKLIPTLVKQKNKAKLDALRQAGFNFQAQDSDGQSVLKIALQHHDPQFIHYLRQGKANLTPGEKKLLPLWIKQAITKADSQQLACLLTIGDAISWDDDPEHFMRAAIEKGDAGIMQQLVSAGAKINENDRQTLGRALLNAISHRESERARELIKAGANTRVNNTYGECPLVKAAQLGLIDIVKCLKAQNATLTAADAKLLGTELIWAVGFEDLPLIESLLQAGADISIEDEHGDCAVRKAFQKQNKQIYTLLTQFHVDLMDYPDFDVSLAPSINLAAHPQAQLAFESFLAEAKIVEFKSHDPVSGFAYQLGLLIENKAQKEISAFITRHKDIAKPSRFFNGQNGLHTAVEKLVSALYFSK